SAAELEALATAVLGAAGSADWVVASGSLPPRVPVDVYARLCERFRGAGINVAIDTSGPALVEALAQRPALVKPNREELGEATGVVICCLGDAIKAAESLRARGAGTVLASLGADGAILLQDDQVWFGRGELAEPRSSVGAGDAMLAGFLAGGARGPGALVEALAWATAAVGLPGSRMPCPDDIRRDDVRVIAADPTLPLRSGG
uniref:1-phosphofructokinase family hexose kinase n=1 Tax=Streptosporangium amethystogenes TaxID=2002 RepID=UPI0004C6E4F4